MAMTFDSVGCREAANELKNTASKIDTILNNDLTGSIGRVKDAYESDSANELYAAFDKMKAKFPDFIEAVNDCAKYLSDTVAPAYDKVEKAVSSKL